MMSGKLARPPRLSDAVSRQIESWIREMGLAPGTQLPTEKTLCERFGVSRAVVREAISRLRADGCVETRQGAGVFVAQPSVAAAFRLLGDEARSKGEIADIFELRCLVEAGAAELAARRRDDEDLGRLSAALEAMDEALLGADGGSENGAQADDAFHVAVAAATGNAQLEHFLVFMGRQFSASRVPTWNVAGLQAGRAAAAQAEHRRIFDAILARDAEGAREAAIAHLSAAAERLGLEPRRP